MILKDFSSVTFTLILILHVFLNQTHIRIHLICSLTAGGPCPYASTLSFFLPGVSRLSLMVKRMRGESPSLFFRLCWLLLCPLLMLVSPVSGYKSLWNSVFRTGFVFHTEPPGIQHCSVHASSLRWVHVPTVGWVSGVGHLTGLYSVDPTLCCSWDLQQQRITSSGEQIKYILSLLSFLLAAF